MNRLRQWFLRFSREKRTSRARRRNIESLEPRVLLAAGDAWVGNRVWHDVNGNGWQQSGEPGVPDVEVRLFAEGAVEPTEIAVTDAQGIYNFRNIDPGT